ncbi:MAG: phosphate/phosphite/phosphonate ABC transporter substrate-binding protein [Thermodesulfovibrionales bacterium]
MNVKKRFKIIFMFFICVLFVLLSPVLMAGAQETLTLCIHPYLAASDLYKRFTPLAEYLGDMLGKKVKIHLSSDYQEHIEYIGNDIVDIAYMGPASYVKLVETHGKKPVLAAIEVNGKSSFHGVIIVDKNSALRSLKDLEGHKFAFGDPNSTMSHLVPRYMLWKAGINLDELSGHKHLSNHDNVALGVLTGDFDAGAVKIETYYKYKDRGLKVIATSPNIHEHLFVASGKLPEETVQTLRKALLELKDQESGKLIMSSIKKNMTAMVPTNDSDYDNLRSILKTLKKQGVFPSK